MKEETFDRALAASGEFNYFSIDQWDSAGDKHNNQIHGETTLDDFCCVEGLVSADGPEEMFFARERDKNINSTYRQLSDEAKEIIRMVIDAPDELLQIFGVKTIRSLNPKVIEDKLRKNWKDRRYARQVVHEIINFVACF